MRSWFGVPAVRGVAKEPPGSALLSKEHLAGVRPGFLAARAFQRTSYAPGEIGQVDWWHTGTRVPVGRGLEREAFGLVTTLPWSGAHATVFSLGRTVGDLRPSLAGCTERLGGVPDAYVFDNDASVVASREGGRARLHPEVSGLLGALHARAIVLRPARPTSKCAVERVSTTRSPAPVRHGQDRGAADRPGGRLW